MTTTSIQWTTGPDGTPGKTWNPVRGCSRVSDGCTNCYAMRQAHRFSGEGQPYEGLTTIRKGKVDWTGHARFVPELLAAPLKWRKPRRVFVNSMSDLFHESLSNEEIAAVFGVMAACPQHTFQVLTKRPKRMLEWFQWLTDDGKTPADLKVQRYAYQVVGAKRFPLHRIKKTLLAYPWPLLNVWLGVSIEHQKTADERVPLLIQTPAAIRFVSAEPLLGPVNFEHIGNALFDREKAINRSVHGPAALSRYQAEAIVAHPELDWVIVGGESGHGARSCNVEWIRSIVQQCKQAGVPAFVKQLGSRPEGDDCEPIVHADGSRTVTVYQEFTIGDRKGGEMSEWPDELKVREFPEARR